MWLTNVAIRRPLFILMVIGALLVVGLVSWTKLGVDLLPALDFPIVVVTTPYPGASPDAVDTEATRRPAPEASSDANSPLTARASRIMPYVTRIVASLSSSARISLVTGSPPRRRGRP